MTHHYSEQRPTQQYNDPMGPSLLHQGSQDNTLGLPIISGARRGSGKHDTPVIHANMKRNYPNTIANPK